MALSYLDVGLTLDDGLVYMIRDAIDFVNFYYIYIAISLQHQHTGSICHSLFELVEYVSTSTTFVIGTAY